MELKDYLHLYLGCPIADSTENNFIVCDSLDGWFLNYIDKSKRRDDFKPILRRLEDMTEEEAKAVYTIEKDRVLHETILDFDLSKRDHGLIIHRLDDLNVSMMMGFDGVLINKNYKHTILCEQ